MADFPLSRDQRFPSVGTSDGVILGSNPRRKHLIISSPVPSNLPGTANNQAITGASTATTGTKLTYTVPAGKTAVVGPASSTDQTGTTQVMSLQLIIGGALVNVLQASGNLFWNSTFTLAAGDTIRWGCTTALAASTVDLFIAVSELLLPSRVTLNFAGPAVLDNGINLYPGNVPLYLVDEFIGRGFKEEIHAIAAQAATQISVVELSGP